MFAADLWKCLEMKPFQNTCRKRGAQCCENTELRLRKKRMQPKDVALQWIEAGEDPQGFKIILDPIKGRGIVTTMPRKAGDFLLQYCGEIITGEEGERREDELSSGFRFFFGSKRNQCIDATEESNRLGRLANHGSKKEKNATMKEIEGNLVLFAIRDISSDEEVLYDYGLKNLPWEKEDDTCSTIQDIILDFFDKHGPENDQVPKDDAVLDEERKGNSMSNQTADEENMPYDVIGPDKAKTQADDVESVRRSNDVTGQDKSSDGISTSSLAEFRDKVPKDDAVLDEERKGNSMSNQTADEENIIKKGISAQTDNVLWIKYYSKKRGNYYLDPKEFTIVTKDIVKTINPPDLVWTGGSRFAYKFDVL